MLIDWFTVAAQVVNFLVLVALLKRFLYRPILTAMESREARIAAQLAEAAAQQHAAEAARLAHLHEQQELAERRQALLAQAEKDAGRAKEEMVRQARREVEDLQTRWQEALAREKDLAYQDMRRQLLLQIAAACRLALRDLAGVELEQRVAEAFLMRLAQADAAIRAEFVEAVREADGRVLVTGGFAVPQEMQPRLVQALRELAGRDVDAAFHVSPDLIAGLEVRAGGCKIAWSLEDFLQGLEAAWAEALADLPGRRPA